MSSIKQRYSIENPKSIFLWFQSLNLVTGKSIGGIGIFDLWMSIAMLLIIIFPWLGLLCAMRVMAYNGSAIKGGYIPAF
jgi:hypothetical protein